MTQLPQDPGDAPYGGANQQPPPGQLPDGVPHQRPYTESAAPPAGPPGARQPWGQAYDQPPQPAGPSYQPYQPPSQPSPPYGQPGAPLYGQPSPPYGQPSPPYGQPSAPPYGQPGPAYGPPARQPAGSPHPVYPARPGGYQGKDPSLAEWWRRLLGWVIDCIALTALTAVLWIRAVANWIHQLHQVLRYYPDSGAPAAQAALNRVGSSLLRDALLLAFISLAVSFCYYWMQHARWGQTLGKRALGTMVVTADGRSKITGGAAAGRAAVFVLAPAVPFVGGIFSLLDCLWLTWDPGRQCLHDKAASTVVIKTRAPAPAAPPLVFDRQQGQW